MYLQVLVLWYTLEVVNWERYEIIFCKNCGKEIDDKAAICVHCGIPVKSTTSEEKSWGVALALAFFLGGFGTHRFYTGHTGSAVVQMILSFTVIGLIISLPWIWIDFFSILCGSFKTKDGQSLACKFVYSYLT